MKRRSERIDALRPAFFHDSLAGALPNTRTPCVCPPHATQCRPIGFFDKIRTEPPGKRMYVPSPMSQRTDSPRLDGPA